MKLLLVGDPHVTVEELDDCQALLDYVWLKAKETKPDYVVFLGDQHHQHGVVRVEVLDFWKRNLKKQPAEADVIMLVGNHDRSHNTALKAHTLLYHDVMVVDQPIGLENIVTLIPWMPDNEDFINAAMGAANVIGHNTIAGSHYENGFYDPHGIELHSLMGTKTITSGHIHSPQEFSKEGYPFVWYPGSPRARTITDANQFRAIWLVEYSMEGIVSRTPFSTEGVCRMIYQVMDHEHLETVVPELVHPYKLLVNIHGSDEYIEKQKKFWATKGGRISTFPTSLPAGDRVRESEGVMRALDRHVEMYQPKLNTPKEVLQKMVQERIYADRRD